MKPVHSGGRVFGLDLLRAAAILMVICAHGFVVLYPHFGEPLGFFGHGGFYGVELFFVLSGFLIGQILIRTGADLALAGNVAFSTPGAGSAPCRSFFYFSSSTSSSSTCFELMP